MSNKEKQISLGCFNEAPFAVTVCDEKGIITGMNKKSIATFRDDGGEELIGTNLLDCHPEPSRTMVEEMLKEDRSNIYTIEKQGVRKIIIQSPWYNEGEFAGLIELSVELPKEMEHFVRG